MLDSRHKKFMWIPITLFAVSGIFWVAYFYLFMVGMGSNVPSSFAVTYGDFIYISARVLLVVTVTSLVFIISEHHRTLNATAVILAFMVGGAVFQIHENAVQRQALTGCLGAVSGGDPSYSPNPSLSPTAYRDGMIAGCYESNGMAVPTQYKRYVQ
ncbi:MAG TPA: hypothetical protein VGG13_03595 [Candidatus Saccharimonadales bacterium]